MKIETNFFKNKLRFKLVPSYALSLVRIALGINVFILLLVAVVYPFFQPVVPLFYSLADPQQHLVHKVWLFLLPALSFIFNATHLLIIRYINQSHQFVIKLFIKVLLILQVILLLISIRSILIVFKL